MLLLRDVELRKLPAGTLSVIVDILETNNDWKKVMSTIPKDPNSKHFEPKYNIEQIRQIEEYAKQTNQLCAEILLNEWGTSSRVRPTLATLKDVVLAAGIYRAGVEIARMLQEPPPARSNWGPEQAITTSITNILNQNMQHTISTTHTAHTIGYNDMDIAQNQTPEPQAYYGVESVNTADLPNISALQ